jgi:hypothetical protein
MEYDTQYVRPFEGYHEFVSQNMTRQEGRNALDAVREGKAEEFKSYGDWGFAARVGNVVIAGGYDQDYDDGRHRLVAWKRQTEERAIERFGKTLALFAAGGL